MVLNYRSGGAEVKSLEAFERKRAAIETIFTLAVLYVGILQILDVVGIVARVLALIPVGVLLYLALLIGGDNLWEQIKVAIGRD